MEYIYFATIDNDLIDNYELANVSLIKDGTILDPTNYGKVREYASTCKGVTKEIKHPSVKFLVLNGKKYKAMRIYRDNHPGLSLREVKEIIDKMEEDIKSKISIEGDDIE